MSEDEEEGHLRFLQEGDSSVLSAEGQEVASFIETHPGFSNMADNDINEEVNEVQGEGSEDEDDDDDEEEEDLEDDADQEAMNAAAVQQAETERLANIVEAKSLVRLNKKSFQRTRANVSPIWKNWFFIPEIIDSTLEVDLKRLDPIAYDMLLESRKPNVFIFCCKLCYDTPTTTLHNSFKKNSSI